MATEIEGVEVWLRRWREQSRPDEHAFRRLQEWLAVLIGNPRDYPSAHAAWPHPHATGELRTAFLLEADAFVVYVIDAEQVRVIYIGRQPPEGVEFPLPD